MTIQSWVALLDTTKTVHGLGWPWRAVIAAIVLVLVLVFGPPLVLRGPVLGWLFARGFADRCGHFSLHGGHLGLMAVPDLALGRPLHVVLDGISILGPDGKPVLRAASLEATATIHLRPLAIEVRDARIADGGWRFASAADGSGSADAFRPVPPAGRAACTVPAKAGPTATAGPAPRVRVDNARLENLDAELDFPDWGLRLAHVTTRLTLSLDGSFRFAFARAVAASGDLRVGAAASEWLAAVPFDNVVISRVAVVPESGTDLLLEVESARTGRADLSGRALFRQLFAAAPSEEPGVDVDARWRRFGDALMALKAPWRPDAKWLGHIDGDLHATLHGPFSDLAAMVEAEGSGARVQADLAHGVAGLRVACKALDTTWMLAPAVRRLLGGRLSGSLAANMRLAPAFAGLVAEISRADLRLERGPGVPGPHGLVLRVGRVLASGGPGPDLLWGTVRGIGLAGGRLTLAGARVDWSRLSASAGAQIDFATSDLARSRVSAQGRLRVGSLADWIPHAEGHLVLDAQAQGTLAALDVHLGFAPSSTVVLEGQRFGLPPSLALRWGEDTGLALSRCRVRAGAGAIVVGGRLDRDDQLAAEIGLSDVDLNALSWLADSQVGRDITGTLAGRIWLSGPVAAPRLTGTLRVPSLGFRGRALGRATATFRLAAGGGALEAQVGPALAVKARVRRSPRLAVDADLTLRRQALGPWLPRRWSLPAVDASGTAHLAYGVGRPLVTEMAVDLDGAGLHNVKLAASSRGDAATGQVHGQLELAPWRGLWSRHLASAEGALSVDLEATRDGGGTQVFGDMVVVRELGLRLSRRGGTVHVSPGDKISLHGDTVSTTGLHIQAPWFHGQVAGRLVPDRVQIARSQIDASVGGTLELGALPVRLPTGTTLGGRATVRADLHGALVGLPGPRLSGEIALVGAAVQLPGFPKLTLDGTVHARGDRLATDGLDLAIAHVGSVTIGTSASPASASLTSVVPFQLGMVDIPFTGTDLVLDGRSSPVQVRDLDIDARLVGPARARLLQGQVAIAGGVLRPSRIKAPAKGRNEPWYKSLPPGLTVDLRLRAIKKGLRVSVPLLPDVTVDFDCRLQATRQHATLTGSLRGDGLYDRTAVDLYAWLADKDLRGCRVDQSP